MNSRAWDAARDSFAPDLLVTDHRPLGLGVVDRDRWIASLQATDDLSAGLSFEIFRVLTWNDRGLVVAFRCYGSLPDGGGPFENFPIAVVLNAADRIARYELFDEADADRAVARFAELCAAAEAEEMA